MSASAPPPRYVFDTSVLVSALLFEQSPPGRALAAARDHGQILLSEAVTRELSEVLARPKFDRYATRAVRDQFLALLIEAGTVVEVTESVTACRDPKDNKFLELA